MSGARPGISRRLAIVAAYVLLAVTVSAEAQESHQKRVLVFTALRKDAPVPATVDREFQRILGDGLSGGIDYYSESIDVARFPDEDYQAGLRDFLARKYHGRRFDVVVAISDVCINFVDKNRNALFPGAPVVFIAGRAQARLANSTGVFMGLDLSGTIALAQRLQPDAQQVFVVSGASDNDRFYEQLARTQLDSFTKNLAITYLSGLAIADLERRLAALPPRSIVYYLIVTQDGEGRNFLPLEALDRVAAAANAPLYSFIEIWMDDNMVGGSLLSITRPVRSAADLALRVLRGESADSIATLDIDPHINQVDWRQLRRWGISESRIPAGTGIRFREPGPWDRYKSLHHRRHVVAARANRPDRRPAPPTREEATSRGRRTQGRNGAPRQLRADTRPCGATDHRAGSGAHAHRARAPRRCGSAAGAALD